MKDFYLKDEYLNNCDSKFISDAVLDITTQKNASSDKFETDNP